MRDVYVALVTHCGGEDYLSEPLRMTARRVASLEAELVYMEDGFAKARAEGHAPEASELDLYSRLSNTQRRHLEAVGWERKLRDVTPDLAKYIEAAKA